MLPGSTFSNRVRRATVPARRSAFGSTRMLVVPPGAVIGNMFAATYTPSRFTPSVGKSAHRVRPLSLGTANPFQPFVGSDEFDTATRKLFGPPELSADAANHRPLEASKVTRGSKAKLPAGVTPALRQKSLRVLVWTRAPSAFR